jgi:hypothetical protein
MPLEPGRAAIVERVVTRELTADVLGHPGVAGGTRVEMKHQAARGRRGAVGRESEG